MEIRDRIKEFRRIPAEDLMDHRGNWRRHPQAQRDALRAILQEVGIAGALIAYHSPRADGKLVLLDGHLRKTEHGVWPTLVLDIDDHEADLLLSVYDPLSAMAQTDHAALTALLAEVSTESAALLAVHDGIRPHLTVDDPPTGPAKARAAAQQKWNLEVGQVWQIGTHRLAVGDAMDEDLRARLLDGVSDIALVNADPPYELPVEDQVRMLNDLHATEILWWSAAPMVYSLMPLCSRKDFRWTLYWDAGKGGPGGWQTGKPLTTVSVVTCFGDPNIFHEKAALGAFGIEDRQRVPQLLAIYRSGFIDGAFGKPNKLIAGLFHLLTGRGDSIYEPFAGNGDAIFVGEQTGRRVFATELDLEQAAIALETAEQRGLEPALIS